MCAVGFGDGKWWGRRKRDFREMEDRRKEIGEMCVSAELLKPNQTLSWAMGQHVTYLWLCVGT